MAGPVGHAMQVKLAHPVAPMYLDGRHREVQAFGPLSGGRACGGHWLCLTFARPGLR
jgi:hypothetical protein